MTQDEWLFKIAEIPIKKKKCITTMEADIVDI